MEWNKLNQDKIKIYLFWFFGFWFFWFFWFFRRKGERECKRVQEGRKDTEQEVQEDCLTAYRRCHSATQSASVASAILRGVVCFDGTCLCFEGACLCFEGECLSFVGTCLCFGARASADGTCLCCAVCFGGECHSSWRGLLRRCVPLLRGCVPLLRGRVPLLRRRVPLLSARASASRTRASLLRRCVHLQRVVRRGRLARSSENELGGACPPLATRSAVRLSLS